MLINGWQRLWVLSSILWAVVILALGGILQSDGDQFVPSADAVLLLVRLWIVPVAAVYGLGLGLAWVRRGFQVESN
jgi:membrane protease YdiL (CAAX protease family)